MRRTKQILELALKRSATTNSGQDSEDDSFSCQANNNIILGCDNIERSNKIDSTEKNNLIHTLVPNVSINMPSIKSGADLLEFKQNLRPRRSNVLQPTYNHSDSSKIEPFSPDVSEYVPSDYEQNKQCGTSKENDWEMTDDLDTTDLRDAQDFVQPNTTSNIGNTPDMHVGQGVERKRSRSMPRKTNSGRKRNRNPEKWQSNIKRKQKNLGQEFINQRGRLMEKKELKSGCNEKCMRKCSEKMTAEIRTSIFTSFWALGDHNNQLQFVSRCVERVSKKQVLMSRIETSRRHWSFKYTFSIDDTKIQVCKKMFFDTLNITDKWVTTIYKKIDKHGSDCAVLDDRRGQHNNRPNQVHEDIKATVRSHISQMPLVDSHYVRAKSQKKYFEESLTFSKLYKLYKEWLVENHYEPGLWATERQYRTLFYNEYNIDFFKPKKDLCPTCDIYKRASTEEKEALQINFTHHIAHKSIARELKAQHTLLAKQGNTTLIATYDLQKILTTPMSEVSLFYYKRKLAVYNFTIFDVGKSEGFCYVWNETIAKKGANEISSSVYLFIEMKAKEGIKDFYFYSDNCGGQNRNRIVFAMYSYAAEKFNVNITHVFFEVGHTQNEGDSMHALIERRKKNQIVYVPEQWVQIIRCAKSSGKPYSVNELNQCNILNFKILINNKQLNFEVGSDNNKIKWNKIRYLSIKSENPKLIQVIYDFLSETNYYIDLGLKRVSHSTRKLKNKDSSSLPDSVILPAYHGPIPISKAKYIDLNNLCNSKVIPELYHSYYKNLKHSADNNNTLDLSDSE